jgi:hypothetical protein
MRRDQLIKHITQTAPNAYTYVGWCRGRAAPHDIRVAGATKQTGSGLGSDPYRYIRTRYFFGK